jgi:hypothetical protein
MYIAKTLRKRRTNLNKQVRMVWRVLMNRRTNLNKWVRPNVWKKLYMHEWSALMYSI